jgi:HPt (histidine-containing phosphotransfer) domain-containing protein
VGVLVVSRSHTISSWTTGEAQTLNGLCGVLASALSAARKAVALSRQVDELTQSARDREKALLQVQAEVQSSKEELRRLSAQVGRSRSADPVVRQREAMRPTLSVSQRPFFEQVTLQLERLDEARGRLVVSPGDSSAFSELIYATSALKEMSATTGYPTLAKLAGTLADALQRKDSGQSMTPGVLALVGESAQALRALLADAQADRSPGLDTTPLLGRLMSLPGARTKEETRGMPSGAQTLLAQVRLNRDTPLKTARAMMVLMQIKRVGQVVACQPVEADIRSGGFEDQFAVTFTTSSKPESVRAALAAIPDVVDVQMSAA